MKGKLFLLSMVLAASAGCARIEFIGDPYPPTMVQPQVYVSEEQAKKEHPNYKMFGYFVVTAPEGLSMEMITQQVREKGMTVGADAVIIHEPKSRISGSSAHVERRGSLGFESGRLESRRSSYSSSHVRRERVLRADCLKFE